MARDGPTSRRRETPWRILPLALVFAAPALYLTQQALFDPGVAFLPPSLGAGWAFHPVQHILTMGTDGPASRDVAFLIEFDGLVAPGDLRLRAFTDVEVMLNDVVLAPVARGSWKEVRRYELGGLSGARSNSLVVTVRNGDGIPSLQVEAPAALRTPGRWDAALGPDFSVRQPVVGPLWREDKLGPLQDPPTGEWMGPATVVWLAAVVLLSLVAVARGVTRSWKWHCQELAGAGVGNRHTLSLVAGAALAASLTLQLWNAARFPYDGAEFDWAGHVEYVRRLATDPTLPLATEGWQMFQPPLYYYLAGLLFRVTGDMKSVQFLGALAGVGLVVLAWLYVRRFTEAGPGEQVTAVVFAGFLPMVLYMSPLVSNETFAALVAAAALYLVVSRPVLAGLIAGLALLCKFTGLFVVLAGAATLGMRVMRTGSRITEAAPRRQRAAAVLKLGGFLAAVLLVSGWFYARNYAAFGTPFIGNWDERTGFHYRQNPSYRSLDFYTSFGQVFFQHPERSLWTSWWDGNYATMWADAHTNFYEEQDRDVYLLQQVMLLLAALPAAAIVIGFARTAVSAVQRPPGNSDLLLVALSVAIGAALIWFSMRVPAYSTVKAFFFLALVPTMAVYLVRGRGAFRWVSGAALVFDGVLGAMTGLAIVVYRFP